jgi:ABC-2 type transport system ATP-binding protein
MSEVLRVEGLRKSFGRREVLSNLGFTLESGRVHGLLGRNGEGKTTLARILLGVIPRDGGRVTFKGSDIAFADASYKQAIGLVPEDPFFYEAMSVGELIRFNSTFFPRWNAGKAADSLASFGLEPKARIRQLSRGQKLKLELAVALAAEPELLVLDDPTSGLDVPTRQDVLKGVIRNLADAGTTVLFATHMVHELERIVDRLFILHGGRLVLDEDYERVKAAARSVRLLFAEGPPEGLTIPGSRQVRVDGRTVEAVVYPWDHASEEAVKTCGASDVEISALSLEDIFVSFVS